MSRSGTIARLLTLLLMALSWIAFGSSLTNEFALDDLIHVLNNPAIRTVQSSVEAFFQPMFPGNLYRPIVTLSYGATYFGWGLNPLPYHCINVLLHCLVVALVFRFLLHWISPEAAFWAAALFAVHPLHTESVANISGRAELLSTLFALLALHATLHVAHAKRRRLACYAGIFIASLAAFLSKESSLALVILIPLLLRQIAIREQRRPERGPIAIVVIAAAIALTFRAQSLGTLCGPSVSDPLDNPLISLAPSTRALAALKGLGDYLVLIFFPSSLSSDYSFGATLPSGQLWSFSASMALTAAITFLGASLVTLCKGGIFGFLGSWFFISFLITSNIFFPIGTNFAERLAYFPSIGVFACLGAAMVRQRLDILRRIICIAIVCTLAAMTARRIPIWRNSYSIAEALVLEAPESAKAQHNYAVTLRNRGELDLARQHAEQSLRIYPKNEDPHFLLGSIELMAGNERRGESELRAALEINARHVPSLNLLGRLELNRGNIAEAERLFSRALAVSPLDVDAHIGMLACAMKKSDRTGALQIASWLDTFAPEREEYRVLREKLGN